MMMAIRAQHPECSSLLGAKEKTMKKKMKKKMQQRRTMCRSGGSR